MSHIAKIELEIRSVDALKAAAKRLGWVFCEGQKTYKWFGRWVGDTPLPEGVDKSQLGHCEHAIRIPGTRMNYELGVVKTAKGYQVLWDYWDQGVNQVMMRDQGNNKLKQAYSVEMAKMKARQMGYGVKEMRTETGIRLVITQGR